MKMFGSSLFGRTVTAAGVGAALMLSVSAGYTQAGGPFAGFDGNWAGAGTVSLSNGTKQVVQISSKGEIRGVNITLSKT